MGKFANFIGKLGTPHCKHILNLEWLRDSEHYILKFNVHDSLIKFF